MNKRILMYVQHPLVYEIRCDLCDGTNIDWSEYDHMIWCWDCKKDTRGSGGIFEGPIPEQVSKLLGISFDKVNLKTQEIYTCTLNKKGTRYYWKKTGKYLKRSC